MMELLRDVGGGLDVTYDGETWLGFRYGRGGETETAGRAVEPGEVPAVLDPAELAGHEEGIRYTGSFGRCGRAEPEAYTLHVGDVAAEGLTRYDMLDGYTGGAGADLELGLMRQFRDALVDRRLEMAEQFLDANGWVTGELVACDTAVLVHGDGRTAVDQDRFALDRYDGEQVAVFGRLVPGSRVAGDADTALRDVTAYDVEVDADG